MPLDLPNALKLVVGLILIILPGYLWSYLFSKTITRLERIVVGFILSLILFTAAPFLLNVFFHVTLSWTVLVLLFLVYLIPAAILFCYFWFTSGTHEVKLSSYVTWKTLLLLVLLSFTVFMTFLPHLFQQYYLPFHVDEWIHWSYSRSIMDSGAVMFPDPYTGVGSVSDPEIGFHVFTASASWLTSSSLLTLFLFMPSVLAVFLGLTAYCIGERSERKFGFEACLLVSLIPTTTRYLGPSFYVAVSVSLLLLVFLVWLIQQKQYPFILLVAPVIWCLALIHPASAFAGLIVVGIYGIILLVEKNMKTALTVWLTIALTCIPFLILLLVPSQWKFAIDIFLNALGGEQFTMYLGLPAIYVNFSDLGVLTWALFVLGYYYIITRGKSLQFAVGFSAVAFLAIIGLYSLLGLGIPVLYDRSFLYLFVFVALVAAIGLRELRSLVDILLTRYVPQKIPRYDTQVKHLVFPVVVVVLLVFTAVPAHLDTPYYKMITEKDYASFVWIRENINRYRDVNHTYTTAAVHPYKASPFSAITGLHIVTSSMHPVLRYDLHDAMESFLADQCRNTTFLEKYKITVVYGSCDNSNLTMIYPKVYLYTNLTTI